MKRIIPHLIVFLAVAAAYLFGALEPLDNALTDLRFKLLQRPASGTAVVVAIDARSLRELDVWPWPRRLHARVLERLLEAGAEQVAIDIDFSSRSSEIDDRMLAASMQGLHGQVILPVFRQYSRAANGELQVIHTRPLAALREHVRLGSVNVRVGRDGRVRSTVMREHWQDEEVLSMAALLAGAEASSRHAFTIDYGIKPETVPRLSFVDVLRGDFDRAAVAGKQVIVGATAVELGDQFTVPVYNVLPGPMLQAMAYESLVQGRALYRSGRIPVLVAALLLAVLLGPRFSRWSWRISVAVAGGVAGLFVALPFGVQSLAPLVLDVAPIILVPLISCGLSICGVVDAQALSIIRHRLDALHRRAMMQSVVDDSFDGIAIVNLEGVVELFNPAAEAILERPAADVVGTPIHTLIPWSGEIEKLYEAAEGDAPLIANAVGPGEFTILRADGAELVIELVVSASRLTVSKGAMDRRNTRRMVFIYTFRDITERKRTEVAQRRAAEEATAANRAKTEFLANMSHELRTPLNAVIGFAEIIRSEAFGPLGAPEYTEYVGDIYNSGQHLLAVINDILDMSKIEAGEMEPDEKEFHVEPVIASCLRLVAERADKGGVELSVDQPDDLPPLLADERMLKQILLNLLSNAVKFTPQGGHVSLSTNIDQAGCFVFSVADTGIGIANEDLGVIMAPFGQVDTSLAGNTRAPGWGCPWSNRWSNCTAACCRWKAWSARAPPPSSASPPAAPSSARNAKWPEPLPGRGPVARPSPPLLSLPPVPRAFSHVPAPCPHGDDPAFGANHQGKVLFTKIYNGKITKTIFNN